VQMTSLKPRGAEGGPKRTPPHLGDAWQKKNEYEVEQVIQAPSFNSHVTQCRLFMLLMSIHFTGFNCLFYSIVRRLKRISRRKTVSYIT
jgi:hypothetical protein